MIDKLELSWRNQLSTEFEKAYMQELFDFLKLENQTNAVIYPESSNIFKAFELTTFDKLQVVIIGQDPYHGEGQANGLCFSVSDSVPIPPSLKNIYKEINSDLKVQPLDTGNLERWAVQGVLLLNSVLTVRKDEAGSHRMKGWEKFTDRVIQLISDEKQHIVFLLWGNYAKEKIRFIDTQKHLVLCAAHPSPLSAYNGFFGCRHFSKANTYLKSNALREIDWK